MQTFLKALIVVLFVVFLITVVGINMVFFKEYGFPLTVSNVSFYFTPLGWSLLGVAIVLLVSMILLSKKIK